MKIYLVNLRKREHGYVELQTFISKNSNDVDKLIEGKSIRDYEVIEIMEEELNRGLVRVI